MYRCFVILIPLAVMVLFFMSVTRASITKVCVVEPQGNAGCLLRFNDSLLVVKTVKSGKWDIPSGRPEDDETADQTAVRETWEETGLHVKAVRLLEDFKGEFYVYECLLLDNLKPENIRSRRVPTAAKGEISEVAFVKIDVLTPDNVRFPSVLPRIRELFKKLAKPH